MSSPCEIIPSTCEIIPSTYEIIPSACGIIPSTCEIIPSTCEIMSSTCGIIPSTCEIIAAVQAQFDVWMQADDAQGSAQSDATTQRDDRDALLKEITATRIDIQLAADALWPYTDKKNAAVRRVFQLPPDRPFRP